MKRFAPLIILGAVVAVALVYLSTRETRDDGAVSEQTVFAQTEYVGVTQCAQCHQAQVDDWRGSHHDLAMQHATEDSVLGDFNDQRLNHYGIESAFTRKQGKHFVRT